MADSWEVEQKYQVDDRQLLVERLAQLGFVAHETEYQADTYYRHPCRDFRASDEAFRIRQSNDAAHVTYKGPRVGEGVKTRPEIELDIQMAQLAEWQRMLENLGFQSVPVVRKTRSIYRHAAGDWVGVLVALDRVELLGEFAEIEVLVADPREVTNAEARVRALGETLGLHSVQRRSYLALLLASLGQE